MAKTSIFDKKNFDLTKTSIFDKKVWFLSKKGSFNKKVRCLTKNSIFDKKFDFGHLFSAKCQREKLLKILNQRKTPPFNACFSPSVYSYKISFFDLPMRARIRAFSIVWAQFGVNELVFSISGIYKSVKWQSWPYNTSLCLILNTCRCNLRTKNL